MENQTIKGIYFSKREIEVISCLCSGCSTKIIARILKISICSVNSYIQRIMLKMNCCSRREIVKFVESSDEYMKIRDIYIEINLGFKSDNDISVGEVDFNTACKPWIIQYMTKSFVILGLLVGFISFGIFLCKNDKCISFEIPAVGKDVLLERKYIAEEISNEFSKTENVNCVALIGTGGIGKTTLAREYLRKSRFEVKAEIDAESEFKIIESLENLLFLLYKNDSEYKILQSIKGIKNIEEKRKKLKVVLSNFLKRYKNWCFLYDNVEDLSMLKKWIPSDESLFQNGNIIVTTRNEHIKTFVFSLNVKIMKIGYLTEGEGEDLFFRVSTRLNKNFIGDRKLVKLLLKEILATPLDIISSINFMHKNNIGLKNYLNLIKERGINYMNHKMTIGIGDYDKTRESIIATTFEKIVQASDKNYELFLMLCFSDSQNIDKSMFQTIALPEDVELFFNELKNYSILEKNKKSFSIHRLNQEMGLNYLLKFNPQKTRNGIKKIIESIAPYNQILWAWFKSEKKLSKDKARLLIPHLESALSKLEHHRDLEHFKEYKAKILTALYFAYNGEISYKESYEQGKNLIDFINKTKSMSEKDFALILLQHVYVSTYSGITEDIEKNAKECIAICDKTEGTDHLKIGAMIYLVRYYLDFSYDYDKGKEILDEILEFKKNLSKEDWNIVRCVSSNQIYRSYEAYYINDKKKIFEAIGYLEEDLKAKGFGENYRQKEVKEIPLDKTVFIMYAIEMMINISRAYNTIGDFDKAYENELDIKYIQNLLEEKGIRFLSQEFQFNTVYGETLVRKNMIDEAKKVLTEAVANENISSDTDKFYGYVSKAETDISLKKYEEVLKDCEEALKIQNQNSNRGLLKKCKCLYFKSVASEKIGKIDDSKRSLKEFWEIAKKLNKEIKKISGQKLFFEKKLCEHMDNCLKISEKFLKELSE